MTHPEIALEELYRRGVVGFADRVGRVKPDQWHAPTPCTEWDVRTLVNHIVYEELWSVPLLAGATMDDIGERFERDLLGDDPVMSATTAAHQAIDALTQDGALTRSVHLSFGDTPATEYVRQLLADHIVHSWDLAVAIGADRMLDPEAVQECRRWFATREELYRRAGMIAEAVPLPDDAGDQDRLIAAFGRDPASY